MFLLIPYLFIKLHLFLYFRQTNKVQKRPHETPEQRKTLQAKETPELIGCLASQAKRTAARRALKKEGTLTAFPPTSLSTPTGLSSGVKSRRKQCKPQKVIEANEIMRLVKVNDYSSVPLIGLYTLYN